MGKENIFKGYNEKLCERLDRELRANPVEPISDIPPILQRDDHTYISVDRASIDAAKSIAINSIYKTTEWTSQGLFEFFDASYLLTPLLNEYVLAEDLFCLGISCDEELESISICFGDYAVVRIIGDDYTLMTPCLNLSFTGRGYECLYGDILLENTTDYFCAAKKTHDGNFDIDWRDFRGTKLLHSLLRYRRALEA